MQPKQLSRSMIDRALGGVCGGLGEYLGINPWWVRGTFILFAFFTLGVTVVIYIVLWLILPQQSVTELPPGAPRSSGQANAETLILLGGGVILLGVAVLAVSLGVLQGARGDILLPFLVIGLGVILFAQQLRKEA